MIKDLLPNAFEKIIDHRIKTAFPLLPDDFTKLLFDRFEDHGFEADEITMAVNDMIDNCTDQMPTVAEFLFAGNYTPVGSLPETKKPDAFNDWPGETVPTSKPIKK